jgi:hypothetical protein
VRDFHSLDPVGSTAIEGGNLMFCIGHSHVACVEKAASEQGVALTAINFWHAPGALTRQNDRLKLSDQTRQRIGRHAGPVFSMIGGSAHVVLGILVHPRPWDFVLPAAEHLPLAPGTEVIPYGAVKQVLFGLMQEFLEITLQVKEVAKGAIFQMEPPPPNSDAQRILPHIMGFLALIHGMRPEIAPAPFRYKLWRLQSSLLEAHCEEHGIGFVRHPSAITDDEGFLSPEYFNDGAHGNSAYGALVLEQMRRLHETSL